jgi:hypothetical protein
MLEQRGLLLGPWRQAEAGPGAARGRTRPVTDLDGGRPLGFVRLLPGLDWPLLRWLSRPSFEVYETEDASLLCTAARLRGLPWCWEVRDAEERRVAVVYRRLVLDGAGRRLAAVAWLAGAGPARFLGPRGAELGSCRAGPGWTALTFAACLAQAPFTRMALLGATLTYEAVLAKAR